MFQDWYAFSMESINMKRLAKNLPPRKPREPGSQAPAPVASAGSKKVFEGFGSSKNKSTKSSKSKGGASSSSGKEARSQKTVM
mmetsp:Transcript_19896/g.47990  ORF Transcript_19896/g.47990 Transcript_19896/m.47990 type:complete len:83 (+) Transcript_19896:3166-3414(+)